MKSVYTLSIFFFFPILLRGQSPTFSPIGTKWGYTYQYVTGFGDYMKEAVSDTVIKGRICRKLLITNRSYSCGGPTCVPYTTKTATFIAQNQDSIFVFQPWDSTFKFMYHFHSQVGDTLTVPINATTPLKYVCKRVTDTLIGGGTLKKWEFNQICPQFVNTYRIILLEKIGPLNTPISLPNTCLIDGDAAYVMCSFKGENINFQGTNCITSTHETTLSDAVKISPNPTVSFLNIESNHTFLRYKIMDMQGRVHVLGAYTEGGQIDVFSLPQSVYLLQLVDKEGQSVIKRFVKL